MKFTIDVPPDVEFALNRHIAATTKTERIGNRIVSTPIFASVEEFLTQVFEEVFGNLVRQYPSPAAETHLRAVETAEDQLKTAARPTVTKDTAP